MSVNLFDANYYRAANADLRSFNDTQALDHFQRFGLNEGRAFSSLVDLNFYRASNSDLKKLQQPPSLRSPKQLWCEGGTALLTFC